MTELKRQPGRNISVLGSGQLVQTLLEHGLVDQLVLLINPLVLATGKRIFRQGLPRLEFELVDAKPTTSGVIIATYRPAMPA